MSNRYKVMYLCGWFVFDSASLSFRNAHKVSVGSRASAEVLAALYNR
jgi:hypothetical protein